MSQPVPVNILSDEDDDDCGCGGSEGNHNPESVTAPESGEGPVCIDLCTPLENLSRKKKPRISYAKNSNPSRGSTDFPVFIIDDEVTPRKPPPGTPPAASSPLTAPETPTPPPISASALTLGSLSIVKCSYAFAGVKSTPSVVDETPVPELSKSEVPIIRCNRGIAAPQPLMSDFTSSDRIIHLGSDSESERGLEGPEPDETAISNSLVAKEFELDSMFVDSTLSFGEDSQMHMPGICGSSDIENDTLWHVDKVSEIECKQKDEPISRSTDAPVAKRKMSKDEKFLMNEKIKQQKEQEKLKKAVEKAEALELKKQEMLKKAAEKAEAAELKKLQKEKQKWEKGKFAQRSIVAQIDNKVVEMRSIGGHLLTRFGEKDLSYHIVSNPIERSIVWTMNVPEELLQISSQRNVILYVLLIYEAEEFCNLIMSGQLFNQVSRVKHHYPCHKICFLVNRLMAYINKREQGLYKNPSNNEGWKRPPIEEVLAKLTTHYIGVHCRLCADEAELADHVVGLTQSLAACQYRKKLTPLSVNANGSNVPKDCLDRDLIKKDTWLKALVAIPKVQPRFAIAISKKYPTMKSLLSIYMDPTRSVHEKEFLLMDLSTEGLLGGDRRLGEICSKRVYRVLMAQCGTMLTDDVEDGADFFHHQTS